VLVITHKDVRDDIRRCSLKCEALEVAHWGDLDGKNDWKDFGTIVVYGLPYLDDIAPTNGFLSRFGAQSIDWFEGRRRFGDHADMKAALKFGFIARSVVQAINRGHCRKITDDRGNCKPTDVFILLPTGHIADSLTASVQQEMPNSKLIEWCATPDIRNKLSPTERRLVRLLRNCEPGTYSKTWIIVQLSIATRTFERLSASLRKPTSALMRELAAIGVGYDCKIGRGKEACFVKH
jgi:hypothetical protein